MPIGRPFSNQCTVVFSLFFNFSFFPNCFSKWINVIAKLTITESFRTKNYQSYFSACEISSLSITYAHLACGRRPFMNGRIFSKISNYLPLYIFWGGNILTSCCSFPSVVRSGTSERSSSGLRRAWTAPRSGRAVPRRDRPQSWAGEPIFNEIVYNIYIFRDFSAREGVRYSGIVIANHLTKKYSLKKHQ